MTDSGLCSSPWLPHSRSHLTPSRSRCRSRSRSRSPSPSRHCAGGRQEHALPPPRRLSGVSGGDAPSAHASHALPPADNDLRRHGKAANRPGMEEGAEYCRLLEWRGSYGSSSSNQLAELGVHAFEARAVLAEADADRSWPIVGRHPPSSQCTATRAASLPQIPLASALPTPFLSAAVGTSPPPPSQPPPSPMLTDALQQHDSPHFARARSSTSNSPAAHHHHAHEGAGAGDGGGMHARASASKHCMEGMCTAFHVDSMGAEQAMPHMSMSAPQVAAAASPPRPAPDAPQVSGTLDAIR